MSAAIMGRVFYDETLTSTEKLVLLSIADVANDNGFGWLLISTIAMKSSLSARSVRKTLATLIERKMIKKKERHNRSSLFWINVDALPTKKPKVSEREMSDEELWGESDSPLVQSRGDSDSGGGESDSGGGESGAAWGEPDSPITINKPSYETSDNHSPLPPKGELADQDLFDGSAIEQPKDFPERVKDLWNQMADRVEAIPKIRNLTESRKKKIMARTKSICGTDTARDGLDLWRRIIERIEANTFLRGEEPPGRDRSDPFAAYLDFVLREDQFNRILEGAYRANRSAKTHDPHTGRRYGPAEQAGRAVVANVLAGGAKSAFDGPAAAPGSPRAIAGPASEPPRRSAFDRY